MKDLTKAIASKKIIIGVKSVIRNLRDGKLDSVYLSKNCSAAMRDQIEQYSKLIEVDVKKTNETSAEFGILCKKQYNIQAIGILK